MDDHPDLVRLHARPRSAFADGVGVVLDPLVLVGATLVAVSVATATSTVAGLGWAAVTLVFCALLPEAALRLVMRVRGLSDRQLVVREHRHLPVALAAGSVLVGLVVLHALDAPAPVSALVVTILAGVAAMAAITRWWKASFHTAVATSMTVVVTTVFGTIALLPAAFVVALIAWARVRAGRHSLAQVAVGGLVGAATAWATFPVLS